MKTRSPICTFVGHVDHGKSSLLDQIRGTCIVAQEAGGITQAISSSKISLDQIKKISGDLLKKTHIKLTIPGLLFIDTPGHAAFTNLRKRGGNLADIAILVIDINEGLKPQTEEAIEILKTYKTPFIIALNKIDLIPGWRSEKDKNLLESISSQAENTQKKLNDRLYEILGKLYDFGFNAERFDRVSDYTKQIAMIPCSAKLNQGIPELLMVISGLAQRYLENSLKIHVKGPAKGTILEVREEKGIGTALYTIIYDGTIKVNDQIVIGSIDEPIVTKVRSLFDIKTSLKEAHAAANIKINAPNTKEVISGMPLRVVDKDLEKIKEEIQKEVQEVIIETEKSGIVIKADSLGSLEALSNLLRQHGVKIKRANIGDISKKDIADASSEPDELNQVILGFNVKSNEKSKIKIITNDIIYKIIDDFEKWQENQKKSIEAKELENITFPFKIQIMPGYVFRQSNPAVFGVDILGGKIKTGYYLMKEGKKLSPIKEVQHEKKNITEAEAGKQVAIAVPNITVGRQVNEGDILYSFLTETEFRHLKKLKKFLNERETQILKEIAHIMRQNDETWGV